MTVAQARKFVRRLRGRLGWPLERKSRWTPERLKAFAEAWTELPEITDEQLTSKNIKNPTAAVITTASRLVEDDLLVVNQTATPHTYQKIDELE